MTSSINHIYKLFKTPLRWASGMIMKLGKILSVKKSTTINTAPIAATPSPAPKATAIVKELKEDAETVDFTGIPEHDEVQAAPPVVPPAKAKKASAKKTAKAKKPAAKKPAAKKNEPTPPVERPATFNLVDYSEKSIALFGDTKPIKAKLVACGGRFNPALRPWGGETRVPGWIFPIKARPQVQAIIAAV